MASIGSAGAPSNVSNTTQIASTDRTAPATSTEAPVQTSAALKPDVVKLSVAAQAKLMHHQGKSPALIASALGTNVASVDGYLGIKVAPQVAATPAAPNTPATPTTSASTPTRAPQTRTEAPEATAQSKQAPQPAPTQAPITKS